MARSNLTDDDIILDALERYADDCGRAAYRPTRTGPSPAELRRRADRARQLAAEYKASLTTPTCAERAARARTGPH